MQHPAMGDDKSLALPREQTHLTNHGPKEVPRNVERMLGGQVGHLPMSHNMQYVLIGFVLGMIVVMLQDSNMLWSKAAHRGLFLRAVRQDPKRIGQENLGSTGNPSKPVPQSFAGQHSYPKCDKVMWEDSLVFCPLYRSPSKIRFHIVMVECTLRVFLSSCPSSTFLPPWTCDKPLEHSPFRMHGCIVDGPDVAVRMLGFASLHGGFVKWVDASPPNARTTLQSMVPIVAQIANFRNRPIIDKST